MQTVLERAKALRADPNVHYNCAQAVLIPFAERAGLSTEQAYALAAEVRVKADVVGFHDITDAIGVEVVQRQASFVIDL